MRISKKREAKCKIRRVPKTCKVTKSYGWLGEGVRVRER